MNSYSLRQPINNKNTGNKRAKKRTKGIYTCNCYYLQ